MLPMEDKTLKKEACDLFKLVQIYMGDRKCKPGMTCNSVALELCNHAWNKPALRDELYLHVCRQTTENPRKCVEPSCRIWNISSDFFSFLLFQGESKTRMGADGRLSLLLPAFTKAGALSRWLHQPSSRSRSQFHRSRQMAHPRNGWTRVWTFVRFNIFTPFYC